jgi:hypothetical protein
MTHSHVGLPESTGPGEEDLVNRSRLSHRSLVTAIGIEPIAPRRHQRLGRGGTTSMKFASAPLLLQASLELPRVSVSLTPCQSTFRKSGTTRTPSREIRESESRNGPSHRTCSTPSRLPRPVGKLSPYLLILQQLAKQPRPAGWSQRAVIAPERLTSGKCWWRRRNTFRTRSQSWDPYFYSVS